MFYHEFTMLKHILSLHMFQTLYTMLHAPQDSDQNRFLNSVCSTDRFTFLKNWLF